MSAEEEANASGDETETQSTIDGKKKKMRVNQDYVRDKLKNQLKGLASKKRAKCNGNKDKNSIKAKADIREEIRYN